MAAFEFPEFYSYPPFFTEQPVESVRSQADSLWTNFILSYCRHNKITTLSLDPGTLNSPLFRNKKINRGCSLEFARHLLEQVVAAGFGAWSDDEHTSMLVYEHSLGEWADIFWEWAGRVGKRGGLTTLYQLLNECDPSEPFYELNDDIAWAAIQVLVQRGKAGTMDMASGGKGIKFALQL